MDGEHGLLSFCSANYRLGSFFDLIEEEKAVILEAIVNGI